MGILNYCSYLILQFYPAVIIDENFMHAKIMWFTVCSFQEKKFSEHVVENVQLCI